jgi:hypothetical protein
VTLHELGHAWVHQHLDDDDRAAFVGHRALEHWDEPARWYQKGTEHAAEIMAWGLLDEDIGVRTIAPNDHASLVASFQFLTGVDPICSARTGIQPESTDDRALPRDLPEPGRGVDAARWTRADVSSSPVAGVERPPQEIDVAPPPVAAPRRDATTGVQVGPASADHRHPRVERATEESSASTPIPTNVARETRSSIAGSRRCIPMTPP